MQRGVPPTGIHNVYEGEKCLQRSEQEVIISLTAGRAFATTAVATCWPSDRMHRSGAASAFEHFSYVLCLLLCTDGAVSHRWSEVTRQLELWVKVMELNEAGEFTAVEVVPAKDVRTGGIFQLRQVVCACVSVCVCV